MNRQDLKTLSALFGTAFLLCVGLQLLALVMVIFLHDMAYRWHSYFFDLTPETFDVAIYRLLGLMKTLSLMLFFVPWLAIKIIAKRLPESSA